MLNRSPPPRWLAGLEPFAKLKIGERNEICKLGLKDAEQPLLAAGVLGAR